MTTFKTSLASFASLLSALLLAACNGSPGQVPLSPGGPTCSLGTQAFLSSPPSGSQGNPTSLGRVQIVVNAKTNVLGSAWNLVLLDEATNVSQTGLFPSSTPGTYKPFPANFYYTSLIPPLFASDIYGVYLVKVSGSCSPLLIGSFTT